MKLSLTRVLVASLLSVAAISPAMAQQEATGAGASFPAPLYAKWAADYHKATGVKINYQSVGSGAGLRQIEAKTVDFGASDAPLKDEDLAKKGLVQFPTVIGGVVPVVNENDTVSVDEIRFGDNDRLSALVANLVRAEALVLLTDVDALYTAPPSQPGSRRVEYVPNVIDALGDIQVSGSGSKVGTGGMVTKLEAARVAAVSGIPTVLTCASNAGPAMMGDPVGTVFAPVKARGSSRRLWIGFAADPRGTIVVDAGAGQAIRGGRASLLAAGALEVHGDFSAGDPVWIDAESGEHLARGLAGFDSEEIPQMLGRNTAQLKRFLGPQYAHPLVHRDNLVLV